MKKACVANGERSTAGVLLTLPCLGRLIGQNGDGAAHQVDNRWRVAPHQQCILLDTIPPIRYIL